MFALTSSSVVFVGEGDYSIFDRRTFTSSTIWKGIFYRLVTFDQSSYKTRSLFLIRYPTQQFFSRQHFQNNSISTQPVMKRVYNWLFSHG
jgi:hypothetical protein